MDSALRVDALRSGTPGLLWAYRLGEGGAPERVADADTVDIHESRGGWLWVHIDLIDNRVHGWLHTGPAIAVEALNVFFAADHDQRIEVGRNCIYGALADIALESDRVAEHTGLLRFVLTDGLLLSGRRHPLRSVEAVHREIDEGRRVPGPSALIEAIIAQIADGFDTMEDQLTAALDRVEDAVLVGNFADDGRLLGKVRRAAVRAHRQVAGLRSLIHRLERHGPDRLGAALHDCSGRLAQRLDDVDHEMAATQARARLLQDEVTAGMTATTNRHLYALSIITALFLPPALITGIFGMNTKNLPLGDIETGSWWALGLCLLSAAAVYVVMKRLGILGRRINGRRR